MRRAALFVDRRESALNEAGDFLVPKSEGAIGDDHIRAELGEVLLGRIGGRTSAEEVTVFKSLGLAVEDVASAHHIHERRAAHGRRHLGRAGRGAAALRLEPVTVEDVRARARAHRGRRRCARRWSGSTPTTRRRRSTSSSSACSPSARSRCAGRATRCLSAPPEALARGVYTASAGNMAQGVAFWARRLGVAVHRAGAGATRRRRSWPAIARLGARSVKVPFAEWWQTLVDHGHPGAGGLLRASRVRPRGDGRQRDHRAGDPGGPARRATPCWCPTAGAGSPAASRP